MLRNNVVSDTTVRISSYGLFSIEWRALTWKIRCPPSHVILTMRLPFILNLTEGIQLETTLIWPFTIPFRPEEPITRNILNLRAMPWWLSVNRKPLFFNNVAEITIFQSTPSPSRSYFARFYRKLPIDRCPLATRAKMISTWYWNSSTLTNVCTNLHDFADYRKFIELTVIFEHQISRPSLSEYCFSATEYFCLEFEIFFSLVNCLDQWMWLAPVGQTHRPYQLGASLDEIRHVLDD